jgi:hypothetical protein
VDSRAIGLNFFVRLFVDSRYGKQIHFTKRNI